MSELYPLPKHAPLLIALTERRNADSETYLKPFTDDLVSIGQNLLAIATETEKTAERFCRDKSGLDNKGRYYRFNVLRGLEDVGLEDSKGKNAIIAATDRYIESQAVFKQMQACGKNLCDKRESV